MVIANIVYTSSKAWHGIAFWCNGTHDGIAIISASICSCYKSNMEQLGGCHMIPYYTKSVSCENCVLWLVCGVFCGGYVSSINTLYVPCGCVHGSMFSHLFGWMRAGWINKASICSLRICVSLCVAGRKCSRGWGDPHRVSAPRVSSSC